MEGLTRSKISAGDGVGVAVGGKGEGVMVGSRVAVGLTVAVGEGGAGVPVAGNTVGPEQPALQKSDNSQNRIIFVKTFGDFILFSS
jgi:hypothetical protein